jgi:hypothetical protein
MSLILHPKCQTYKPSVNSSWKEIMQQIQNIPYNSLMPFLNKVLGPKWLLMLSLPYTTNDRFQNMPDNWFEDITEYNHNPEFSDLFKYYKPIEAVVVPFKFSFTSDLPPNTPVTDYVLYNIDEVTECTDLEKLRKYVDDIQDEESRVLRSLRFCVISFKTTYQEAIEYINDIITKLTFPMFNSQHIEMSITEIVNGYKLYNCTSNIMSSDTYIVLKELMDEDPDTRLGYEDFVEDCDFCSDWNKANLTNDDNIDFEDPDWWDNTFEMNARAVWNLPFHTSFLKRTISIGCNNRMEGARYSNYLGVWIERKTKQMNESVKNEIREMNTKELNPLDSTIASYVI